jgi:hypothetical protein
MSEASYGSSASQFMNPRTLLKTNSYPQKKEASKNEVPFNSFVPKEILQLMKYSLYVRNVAIIEPIKYKMEA